jgi:hypothetical protein
MKTVQVAIPDPEYADSIRTLLVRDGRHRVHLVEKPDPALGGVILVDAAHLDSLSLPLSEQKRVIVLVRKERDDLFKIWEAGVRHVLFQGDSAQTARIVVLGVELSLGSSGVNLVASFHSVRSNPAPSRVAAGIQKPSKGPLTPSPGSTRRGQCRGRMARPRR